MKKQISTTLGVLIIFFIATLAGTSIFLLSRESREMTIFEESTGPKKDHEKEKDATQEEMEKEEGENNGHEEKEKEGVIDVRDNKFCKVTEDCHPSICLNKDYLEDSFRQAKEGGFIIDYISIPYDASCSCQKGECTIIIDEEKRSEARERLIANNEGLSSFYNLIDYKSEITTDYAKEDLGEIGRFKINVNEDLIKNKDSLVFNINLPGNLNIVVERKSFLRCEDNNLIANHLCENNQYTWKGEAVEGKSNFSDLIIVGSDEGVLFTVTPINTIGISDNEYIYSVTSNSLVVRERSGF